MYISYNCTKKATIFCSVQSLPNGLISSQCNSTQLTAASPLTAGPFGGGGGTSGAGSVVPPLSRPHSFNSLCSPGRTLVLNPSTPHVLSPLNQQNVGNLLELRREYCACRRTLAQEEWACIACMCTCVARFNSCDVDFLRFPFVHIIHF